MLFSLSIKSFVMKTYTMLCHTVCRYAYMTEHDSSTIHIFIDAHTNIHKKCTHAQRVRERGRAHISMEKDKYFGIFVLCFT